MYNLIIYHDIESSLLRKEKAYPFITEKMKGNVCPINYSTDGVCAGKKRGDTQFCVTKRKICICKQDKPIRSYDLDDYQNLLVSRFGKMGFIYLFMYVDSERYAAEYRRNQIFARPGVLKKLHSIEK